MKTIPFYFLLFAFWVTKVLGLSLGQFKGFSVLNMAIFLLLIAYIIFVAQNKKLSEPNTLNVYLSLMVFVVALSIPIKMMLGEFRQIKIVTEIVFMKDFVAPLIVFFVLFNILDNEKSCRSALSGLLLFLVITVSTMLFVTYSEVEFGRLSINKDGRSAGIGAANEYASFLVLFIPFLLSSFFFQKNILIKITSAVLIILTLTGLVTTGSRGGIISFFVCMSVFLTILYRQKMIGLVVVLLAAGTVFMMGSMAYLFSPAKVQQAVVERIDPSGSEDLNQYTSGRTWIWSKGLELFMESPIYGHGQNTFVSLMGKRYHLPVAAHNEYLSLMVEFGLIGLVAFVLVFFKIFQHVWLRIKTCGDMYSKQLLISYMAGFLGYAFSMLGGNVNQPRIMFWAYTAIIFRYAQLEALKRTKTGRVDPNRPDYQVFPAF